MPEPTDYDVQLNAAEDYSWADGFVEQFRGTPFEQELANRMQSWIRRAVHAENALKEETDRLRQEVFSCSSAANKLRLEIGDLQDGLERAEEEIANLKRELEESNG